MYKEQMEMVTNEQQKTKKETNKLKNSLKEKDESICEHVKKNAELSRKVH